MTVVSSDIRAYFAQCSAHDFLVEQGIPTECTDVDLFVYPTVFEDIIPVYGIAVEFKPRDTEGEIKFPTELNCYLKARRPKNEREFAKMKNMRMYAAYSTLRGSIVLFFHEPPKGSPMVDVKKNYTPEEKDRYEKLERFVTIMTKYIEWRAD